MKSAKEMFEELSFKQTENDDSFIEYQRDDGDQHAEITFSLKAKNFRAIYGRYEFGMTFHYVTSDELKAIVCQAKELGWFESELKQETNLEHYFDLITKLEPKEGVAKVDGQLIPCNACDNCQRCSFNTDGAYTCEYVKYQWFTKPYEKAKYKLSQFEFDLLTTYDDYYEGNRSKCVKDIEFFENMKHLGYFKNVAKECLISEVLENCEIKGE